jgi:glutamyl-Q tRNA(Asp) synthetase
MTAQPMTERQQVIARRPRLRPPCTRFAPSPTGRLHLGHALSAVLAHDLARRDGGSFIVRIEDIDGNRSRPEFVSAILDDLRWLGLDWDGPVVWQSQRAALYDSAIDRLKAQRVLYRCVCTRADIGASASAPQGDIPAPYPGTCRVQPVAADDPRPTCWRLDMAAAGADAAARAWGDVIIARKDALASYHLAVTVDDAAQGVTDVVRGADLLRATAIHRLLQARLGLPTPHYHHHRLVCGPDGVRLAKRTPGATLADLRGGGMDPEILVAGLRCGQLPVGFTLHSP